VTNRHNEYAYSVINVSNRNEFTIYMFHVRMNDVKDNNIINSAKKCSTTDFYVHKRKKLPEKY
jgi:hypothetical protein